MFASQEIRRGGEMKVVIIVPTYNERENIGQLIEALEGQFATICTFLSWTIPLRMVPRKLLGG